MGNSEQHDEKWSREDRAIVIGIAIRILLVGLCLLLGLIVLSEVSHAQEPPPPVAGKAGVLHLPHSQEFWWQALHIAAAGADLATTRKVLDTCPTCSEANPLMGRRPSLGRQLAIGIPMTAGVGYIIHRAFGTGHTRWGKSLSLEYAGIHATCAVLDGRNIH